MEIDELTDRRVAGGPGHEEAIREVAYAGTSGDQGGIAGEVGNPNTCHLSGAGGQWGHDRQRACRVINQVLVDLE